MWGGLNKYDVFDTWNCTLGTTVGVLCVLAAVATLKGIQLRVEKHNSGTRAILRAAGGLGPRLSIAWHRADAGTMTAQQENEKTIVRFMCDFCACRHHSSSYIDQPYLLFMLNSKASFAN